MGERERHSLRLGGKRMEMIKNERKGRWILQNLWSGTLHLELYLYSVDGAWRSGRKIVAPGSQIVPRLLNWVEWYMHSTMCIEDCPGRIKSSQLVSACID